MRPRPAPLLLFCALAACAAGTEGAAPPVATPTAVAAPAPGSADVATTEQDGAGLARAWFDEYPSLLFRAAAASCSAPSETLTRPSEGHLRCTATPTPDTAAALILNFDGTVENLPSQVIAFDAEPQGSGGFVVTVDSYVRVPQRDGSVRQVRFPDAQAADLIKSVLERAGGAPV